jgi:hypothetical protein
VLGSCPLQPSPPSIKMHSTSMGGALIHAPSTTITNRAMKPPSCVTARLFGFDSGSAVFMVSRLFLTFHLGSADFLQKPTHTMPRQRMRPRRGSPWHPRRPRTSSSPSGSSTQALECLAVIDAFDTWWPPSAQHSSPPPAPGHGRPRSKLKTPLPNLPRESYAILHDLVFELRDGVNDLQFRVQQMEGRLSVLLQLLANPPEASPEDSSDASLSDHAGSHQQDDTEGSLQSEGKADTPVPMTDFARTQTLASNERGDEGPVPVAAVEEKGTSPQMHTSTASVRLAAYEDKADDATDMQWTISGTPVIEEPWPGLLPEYVPDYTQLVPYFSSSGSHGS